MPATSVAVPAATEMSEMPAVTEIVRMSVGRYHWGVRMASCWVKSLPATFLAGVSPFAAAGAPPTV